MAFFADALSLPQRIDLACREFLSANSENHMGRRLFFAASALLISSLTACMPTSKIMSNRDPTFTQEPKRIFMLAEFGNDFGRNFADAFRERLIQLVNACGAELHIEQVSTVEIDDGTRAQQIKTFAADVLL